MMSNCILVCFGVAILAITCQGAVVKIRTRRDTGATQIHNVGDQNLSVKETCLHAHNHVRALHQDTPAMTYDDSLATVAADWALQLAQNLTLKHRTNLGGVGENLAYQGSSIYDVLYTPADAVYAWYMESVDYNYDYTREPSDFEKGQTGHFTQVVWKASTRVGCGVARVKDGDYWKTYIVSEYGARGNVETQYVANVKSMKSGEQAPETSLELEKQGKCINKSGSCSMYHGFCPTHAWVTIACAKTCTNC